MATRTHPPLENLSAEVERLEKWVILILAVAGAFFTYRGAAAIEQDADWMAKAGCVLLAVAVGAGLYLMWRGVLALVPHLTPAGRWRAVPVVMVVCCFAVGVSSYFNLVGMIGPDAMLRHMEVVLEQCSDALSFARSRAYQGLAGIGVLRLNYAKFNLLAEDEKAHGGTSGANGSGAIASMLGQVAVVLGSAVHEVEQKVATSEKLAAAGEAELGTMRGILADPTLSLSLKRQRFGTEAETLRLNVLQLAQLEAGSTIDQAIKSAQQVLRPALSTNPAIAARQQAAVDQLTQLLVQLGSLTQAADKKAPFVGKPYQSNTVYTAVLQHVDEFIPAALAACLIDLLMLPCLLLKTLARTDPGPLEAARRYNLAEVFEMRVLMAELAKPATPLQVLSPPTPGQPPERQLRLLRRPDDSSTD
jgi:hypothetical protein